MEATLNGPFGLVTLSSETLTIGRAPGNTLVLSDSKASSRHAEIRSENESYMITDLGSTNGTYVNEQQLRPNEPRQLHSGDTIRVGDTRINYDAKEDMNKTVFAEPDAAAGPGYDATIAVPPPAGTVYGAGQSYMQGPPPPAQPAQPAYNQSPNYASPNYQQPNAPYNNSSYSSYPPSPPQKKSNRSLFIILGSVIGGILLLCIIAGVAVFANHSTPEKTLNTYCDALKSKDYQTAYDQYSQNIQSQESEAQFAAAFAQTRISITNCSVSNTSDDGTIGLGTMSYTTNTNVGGINDYRLIQENGVWKINRETSRK